MNPGYGELLTPSEEFQLDDKCRACHLSADFLHQTDRRGGRSTSGQKVVHHQDSLSWLESVPVNLQGVVAVFQSIAFTHRFPGKLPGFASRHESRPQRNRQRAQQALVASLEVGDDVMTSGGIFGTIVDIDDDEGTVTVEIAPGTRIRMLRQGISQRFVEDEYEGDDGDETADEGTDREP